MAGEAAHVHFVDDCVVKRAPQGPVAFPVVGARIDDDALHGVGAILHAILGRQLPVIRVVYDRPRIGIEQHFGCVEAMSLLVRKGSVEPIAVELPGLESRHKDVPVGAGAIGLRIQLKDSSRRGRVRLIEEQEIDFGGVVRRGRS